MNISLLKKDKQMNYIIFDLEWNQPLPTERSDALPHGEIIQLGFIVADDTLSVIHREEITIKPTCYRKMNPYVSNLTGIKQSDINAGVSFNTAMSSLSLFFADDTVLITWGDDDMPILHENIRYNKADDLILPPHYNLQRIFAAQTKSVMRQTGLKSAAEALGITDDIKAHDALNDAYMTYLIASKLDIAKGISEYSVPLPVKRERASSQIWETEIPRCTANVHFSGKPDGLAEACRKIHICCPECGADYMCTDPVRQGKCSFIAQSGCAAHGTVFIRYVLKDKRITVSCFDMTDKFELIYKNRLLCRERRLKRREVYKTAVKKAKTDHD